MGNKINDPIARLMGLRYKSHPWHGLEVGDDAPELVNSEETPETKPKSKKKIIVISIISLIILAGVIISLYFIVYSF